MATAADSKPEEDLWQTALDTLTAADKARYGWKEVELKDPLTVLTEVLEAVEKRKLECRSGRLKFRWRDKTIVLGDVLEKISASVSKFKDFGDFLVQYDPGHLTLPWAVIRLFLQAGVSNAEAFGSALELVELLSRLIPRLFIQEQLYIRTRIFDQGSSQAIAERWESHKTSLKKALISLYSAILCSLSSLLHELQRNSFKNVLANVFNTDTARTSTFEELEKKEQEVSKLTNLAEGLRSEISQNLLVSMQDLDDKVKVELQAQTKRFQDALQSFNAPISRLNLQLQHVEDMLNQNERRKILKSISNVNVKLQYLDASRDRLEGSGQWLLKSHEYKTWRNCSYSSTLWLHGSSGSGKTYLASSIVDDVKATDTCAFFFCQRANDSLVERSQCNSVLRSLVKQLASFDPGFSILGPVKEQYRRALSGTEDFADVLWQDKDCLEVLRGLTADHLSLTIIIDALDEIDPTDQPLLLKTLQNIVCNAAGLVKVFITSREDILITRRLEGCPNVHVGAENNSEDIARFISERLDYHIAEGNLLLGDVSYQLRKEIEEALLEKANGMFRWVQLQIEAFLPHTLPQDMLDQITKLPSTLEKSYWALYQKIMSRGSNTSKLAIFIFRWVLYAQAELLLDDITHIASIHLFCKESQITTAQVLDTCSYFVTLTESKSLAFEHLSVREFLEGLHLREVQLYNTAESHFDITNACMVCLELAFKRFEATCLQTLVPKTPKSWKVDMTTIYPIRFIFTHLDYCPHGLQASTFKMLEKSFAHDYAAYLYQLRVPEYISPTSSDDNHAFLDLTDQFPSSLERIDLVTLCLCAKAFNCVWSLLDADEKNVSGIYTFFELLLPCQSITPYHDGFELFRVLSNDATYWEATDTVKILDLVPRLSTNAGNHSCGTHGLSLIRIVQALAVASQLFQDHHSRYFLPDMLYTHFRVVASFYAVNRSMVLDRDERGRTPLHYAVSASIEHLMEPLLQIGADPNAADIDGNVPLHFVGDISLEGRVLMQEALIRHGADPLLTNNSGQRPSVGNILISLVRYGSLKQIEEFAQEEQIPKGSLNEEGGAIKDTEYSIGKYKTSLHWALELQREDVVDLFLDNKADIFTADRYGRSPLYYALRAGNFKAAWRMIEAGAAATDTYRTFFPRMARKHACGEEIAERLEAIVRDER